MRSHPGLLDLGILRTGPLGCIFFEPWAWNIKQAVSKLWSGSGV